MTFESTNLSPTLLFSCAIPILHLLIWNKRKYMQNEIIMLRTELSSTTK